ncbi:Kinase [Hexamita inflata]|uniref:CDC7 n=1 Tax=Hexamita inflata TaxID=28002 RepID=A0AA86NCE3_9EUKA|nr:CDC7 [Hexamita inflata]
MDENNTRSTSAITGLTKSATHRSLADPGRTQSRYPQTAKYIQTMLEQTLKRYITLPGIMDQLENEMKESIMAIKSRMFEVCVEQLFRQAKGEEKVWLGRIRDAIRELGAQTVYEIGRGAAFPEVYAGSVVGSKGMSERGINDSVNQKVHATKFINQEDEQLIKQGKVNADILEKIANENRARRLLLEDKYGGQKHRKMMRGWK